MKICRIYTDTFEPNQLDIERSFLQGRSIPKYTHFRVHVCPNDRKNIIHIFRNEYQVKIFKENEKNKYKAMGYKVHIIP